MRKKVITLVLLGTALEVAWLYGGLELLLGSNPLGRLAQEVKEAKSLIGKAGEALKVDPALEKMLKELRAEISPSPGDPSRNPFALPSGIRLLSEPTGVAEAKGTGEGASTEKGLAKAVPPELPARELNGILVGPRDRVAIIDGTLVRAGDSIEGERIIDIRRDRVVLARDGQRRTLHLPPPFAESRPGTEQLEIRPSTGDVRPKRSNGAGEP